MLQVARGAAGVRGKDRLRASTTAGAVAIFCDVVLLVGGKEVKCVQKQEDTFCFLLLVVVVAKTALFILD